MILILRFFVGWAPEQIIVKNYAETRAHSTPLLNVLKLSVPQGQIIELKCEFFSAIKYLFESWLLAVQV